MCSSDLSCSPFSHRSSHRRNNASEPWSSHIPSGRPHSGNTDSGRLHSHHSAWNRPHHTWLHIHRISQSSEVAPAHPRSRPENDAAGSTDVDPTGGSCGKEHRHPLASVLAWAPESTKSSLRLGLQRTRRTFVISNSVSQLDYSGRMGLGITTSRHLAPSGNHPEPPQRGRI